MIPVQFVRIGFIEMLYFSLSPINRLNKTESAIFISGFLLSLFMRDNEKCNISPAPSTGLSDIQFSILNVLESMTPKEKI